MTICNSHNFSPLSLPTGPVRVFHAAVDNNDGDDDDNHNENDDCDYDTVDDTMSTNRHVIASVFLMQGCCSCS